MGTIPSNLKFLHCLRELEHLISALIDGLMLTDHEVTFSPTTNRNELEVLLDRVLPLLRGRLQSLGKPLESLDADRATVVFSGLGNMRNKVPMLCLTEVPKGKVLDSHRNLFGSFGLILKQDWVMRNGADRVIYVGHNSSASQQLFVCLATMRILGLFVDKTGTLLFDNESIRPALGLLSFFETRDHLEETEWRIAGKTSFMGGGRETGKRIPLLLCDIEYIFAPNAEDVKRLAETVANLAVKQNTADPPKIIEFPSVVPE